MVKEYLKLEDLQGGCFYTSYYDSTEKAIIKCSKDKAFYASPGLTTKGVFFPDNSWSCKNKISKATEEEIHWLNKCIKANRFIPESEAMKDFNKTTEIFPIW